MPATNGEYGSRDKAKRRLLVGSTASTSPGEYAATLSSTSTDSAKSAPPPVNVPVAVTLPLFATLNLAPALVRATIKAPPPLFSNTPPTAPGLFAAPQTPANPPPVLVTKP